MKVSISKEKIWALIVLLPYIEGLFSFLAYYKNDAQFRAIIIIQIIMFAMILPLLYNKFTITIVEYKLEILIIIYMLFSIFWTNTEISSYSTLTWIVVPILWGLFFCSYIINTHLNINVFIKYTITYFAFYCCFAIFVNVVRYGLFFRSGVRLSTPGGGAVIFGYTVTVYLVLTILYRKVFSNINFLILLIVFLVTIVGTGSRGALWPALLIIVIYCGLLRTKSKNALAGTMFFVICTVIVLASNIMSLLATYLPRAFNTSDYSRSVSATGVLNIFGKSEGIRRIFGYGLGKVYPYQKWLIDVADGFQDVNLKFVVFCGEVVLVQPHNTFFYLLLESGLLGLIIFLGPFIKYIILGIKKKNFIYLMFISIILFINCFDSVLIVQPGVAGNLWLLLFLTYYDIKYEKMG